MHMPGINTKLKGVFAMRHGYRIRELKTGLIGELGTHQEGRSAKAKPIGDRNVRRNAKRVCKGWRVEQIGLLVRSWILGVFVFEIAAVGETGFVGYGGINNGA